jgi:hypothetical protein
MRAFLNNSSPNAILHPARVLNTASLRGSLGNNLNVNSKFYRAARVNVEIGNLPAPLNGNITTGGGRFWYSNRRQLD